MSNAYEKITMNMARIGDILSTVSWQDYYQTTDFNKATEILITTLNNVMESNTIVTQVAKRKLPLMPWITPGVLKCLRKRDKIHVKLKKSPNNAINKEKFIRYVP